MRNWGADSWSYTGSMGWSWLSNLSSLASDFTWRIGSQEADELCCPLLGKQSVGPKPEQPALGCTCGPWSRLARKFSSKYMLYIGDVQGSSLYFLEESVKSIRKRVTWAEAIRKQFDGKKSRKKKKKAGDDAVRREWVLSTLWAPERTWWPCP